MSVDLSEIRAELEDIRRDCDLLGRRVAALVDRLATAEFELVGNSASASVSAVESTSAGQHTSEERESAARDTGKFFVRCLTGQPRGDSGRSQIRLQNRIYVVVRTVEGVVHTNPVLVFYRYDQVKKHCAFGGSNNFGDSVFAGFASQWEAKVAVRAAGYTWP